MNNNKKAIKYFKESIYERVRCVANYCNPKGIKFEKMLCSLLCLSKNIEGVLFDVIEARMLVKETEYKKLSLQTPEQIYGAIEVNIPDKYVFNKNTTVFVMDCISEKCERLELSDDASLFNKINNTHVLSRGSLLYNLYKKT